jgi:hypothetical protein
MPRQPTSCVRFLAQGREIAVSFFAGYLPVDHRLDGAVDLALDISKVVLERVPRCQVASRETPSFRIVTLDVIANCGRRPELRSQPVHYDALDFLSVVGAPVAAGRRFSHA